MMPEDYDSPESPFIRISRAGGDDAVGTIDPLRVPAARARARSIAITDDDLASQEETPLPRQRAKRPRGSRPMPKRLSEMEDEDELEEQEPEVAEAPAPVKQRKPRAPRQSVPEPEQIPLDLKPAKKKQDDMIRQRQALGFFCVVMAVVTTMMILSYSPKDAAQAETRISDLPAIFTKSDPVINALADTVQNWFGLIGAMTADFLINKTIGYASLIYPFLFGWWSLAFFRFTYKQRRQLTIATSFLLVTGILFSATIGTTQLLSALPQLPREWSGAIGQFLGITFTRLIGAAGALIIYGTLFVITLVFSIDLDIEKTFLRLKGMWDTLVVRSRRMMIEFWDRREARREEKLRLREEEEALEEEEEQDNSESDIDDAKPARSEPLLAQKEDLNLEARGEEPRSVKPRRKVAQVDSQPAEPAEMNVPPSERDIAPIQILASAAPEEGLDPARDIITDRPPEPVKVVRQVTSNGIVSTALPVPTESSPKLLKTRPIPKNADGTPAIPRLRRETADKLGERAGTLMNRLSNGASDQTAATLPAVVTNGVATTSAGIGAISATGEAAPVIAAIGNADDITAENTVESAAEITDELEYAERSTPARANRPAGDDTEGQLDDIADSADSQEGSVIKIRSTAKVVRGDEKIISNEILPHSMMGEPAELRDVVKEHQSASKQMARELERAKLEADIEGLFKDEAQGRRVVVPENPYNELLSKYKKPSLELLTPADPKDEHDMDDEELAIKARLLRDKLATFGVDIENITVTPGPVVTLYEFTPAEGVKVSRVENLTDDIALAMKARGIRIIAPIPGRGTIGVEIPNDVPKMVCIRSLFENETFQTTKMNLPVALGKTISGDVYIDDLNKMPHLLIAGATGSGKSVGVNGIIASLLYAKSPRDVKFVIVDPKKIELSLYKKLRKHYLIVSPEAGEDIVTTPQFAVLALKAVELEMERRYDKLAKAAVRSLVDYNLKVAQGKLLSTQEEQHYHLPYIVVIIDELADLMITAAREIEEPICRIAQMARAVGIHLILATQRPSVDVITGVIKANFPARVAFQVSSRVDSRTILDSIGAEQLLGNGDMLYQPSGTPKPIRLQSPFISTEEVEAIVDSIGEQEGEGRCYTRPWTLPSLKQKGQSGGAGERGMRDEMFDEAARIIVRHQQGSVSLLQRRLKVGYSRAARIVDELEQYGIVGPFDGSKARQVLCETEEELEMVLEGLD